LKQKLLPPRFFSRLFFISSLAFILSIGYRANHPSLPTVKNPTILYNNDLRRDLFETLLCGIQSAKKTIDIQIYTLNDLKFISALNRRAEAGVKITIFYDQKANRSLEKKIAPSISLQPIKTTGLMHRKWIIIDDALCFLSEANFTFESLKLHKNMLLGLYHPGVARFLKRSVGELFATTIGGHSIELFLLPMDSDYALNRVIKEIHFAKKRIYIAMFCLTHPAIEGAILLAKERGVNVQIITDSAFQKTRSILNLTKQAVNICTLNNGRLLHHKLALIDHDTLILGSVNWTKSGFTKNQEYLTIHKSYPDANRVKRVFKILKSMAG